MTSIGGIEITISSIIAYIIDPKYINSLVDSIVPIYTILSIITIISFYRYQKSHSQTSLPNYTFIKKKTGVELTWKQKFVGTWDKFEREGWIDFVLFMGVVQPWFAKQFAKAIENQPLSNVIAFKDETEKIIKVDALGKPESYGPWVEVGDNADTAVASEVEVDKQKCLEKIWWEEETQSMLRTRELTKSGMFVHQSRTITPEDKMILINKTTKSDGTSNTFKVIFKRIS